MKLLNSSLLKYAASVYCNILNFMMFSDMFHDINYNCYKGNADEFKRHCSFNLRIIDIEAIHYTTYKNVL